jgi:hypothetical protein
MAATGRNRKQLENIRLHRGTRMSSFCHSLAIVFLERLVRIFRNRALQDSTRRNASYEPHTAWRISYEGLESATVRRSDLTDDQC